MKTRIRDLFAAMSLLSSLNLQPSTAFAQGTAFTYQGRLNSGGAVANGSYDMQFTLYTTNVTGTAIARPVTNTAVAVTNGLFTTLVDFGPGVFIGTSNWLEIAVSTNAANTFSTLAPRQQLTPVPYAITAENVSGPVSAAQLPAGLVTNNEAGLNLNGTFSGNGASVTNVNAAALNGLTATNFWQLGGNTVAAGQFLGSLNNQPVDFYANTNRALRLQYAWDNNPGNVAPNVIGGSAANIIANGCYGAFIGGGGNASYPNQIGQYAYYAAILGGNNNIVNGADSLAGGINNTVSGSEAVVLGVGNQATGTGDLALGISNEAGNGSAQSPSATAIGSNNHADGGNSTALGYYNIAGGLSAVAMGQHNIASGNYATAMGYNSIASGPDSMALGTYANAANDGAFVWADDTAGYFTSTANNQFLIRATGGVGINTNNPSGNALHVSGNVMVDNATNFTVNAPQVAVGSGSIAGGTSAIALGNNSSAGGYLSAALGNYANASGYAATALGGGATASGTNSLALGGGNASGFFSYALGGYATASSYSTLAIGLGANAGADSAIAIGRVANAGGTYSMALGQGATASGDYSIALGYNIASGNYSTVSGGYNNNVSGSGGFIGGGGYNGSFYLGNTNAGTAAVIIGGVGNLIASGGDYSVISGGYNSYVSGIGSFIGGGGYDGLEYDANFIYANGAVVVGGLGNVINSGGDYSFIGGGDSNTIQTNADHSVIGGGYNNSASGSGSFIGGGNNNISDGGFIGGGYKNVVNSGGSIGGGYNNSASGSGSFIGGGNNNVANPSGSIGGGYKNTAIDNGFIGGGANNFASRSGTVPGGSSNQATGTNSFAAGNNAQAIHEGAFVLTDDSNFGPVYSSGINSFVALFSGGYKLFTDANGSSGAQLLPGATSWTAISDRNAKKNFQPVNTEAVLAKLASIPIQQWNYKWEKDSDVPNIGPMAQDFKKAFYPGRDDKGISTLEFDGVELAAIQGLNEKLEARSQNAEVSIQKLQVETKAKDAEIEELKQRLDALEKLILNQKQN